MISKEKTGWNIKLEYELGSKNKEGTTMLAAGDDRSEQQWRDNVFVVD